MTIEKNSKTEIKKDEKSKSLSLAEKLGFCAVVLAFIFLGFNLVLGFIIFIGITGICWKDTKYSKFVNNGSYNPSNKHNRSLIMGSHTTKTLGHDWSSTTGSNLINSPSFSSFTGNIYHRK